MDNIIFSCVKAAYESVIFNQINEDMVSEFHHHLGASLTEQMNNGNIRSFAISNVNLSHIDGPFVRVSIKMDDSWVHYEFSARGIENSEVVESISFIEYRIV